MHDLFRYKKTFDRTLAAFFNSRLRIYTKLGAGTLVPGFVEQSKYIALASGKRFRPYLADLSYRTFGGKDNLEIREVSLAIELFHIFALIHDDIMDQASARHGVPTIHAAAKQWMRAQGRTGDLDRVSDSQAILVGDLALAWSLEVITGKSVPSKKRMCALESFYTTLDEVVTGQMIEVEATTKPRITLEELEYKHLYKSARYSFVGPIKTGARLATGTKKYDKFAERFGGALGMAFQVQDDLIDALADSSAKGLLTDVMQGQQTYLTYYMLERADARYKKEFIKYFGTNEPVENVAHIISLYTDSGAINFAKSEMDRYFAFARNVLTRGPAPKQFFPKWENVIQIIEKRTS